jgi:RNA polymerase sigma-70 factor (ECF subfamily)
MSDEIARDRAYVDAARQNPEAFGIIFDLYYSKILSYALRRTGDASLAQDIVAETFSKAFKNVKQFTWRGAPFSSWLYRIAGNEIKMHLRRPHRSVSLERLTDAGFDVAAQEIATERELLSDLASRDKEFVQVMKSLKKLGSRYQEVIALRYMEEKEVGEIAVIIGAREGTVRSLLSRGLAKLRQELRAPMQQTATERITTGEGRSVLSVIKQN